MGCDPEKRKTSVRQNTITSVTNKNSARLSGKSKTAADFKCLICLFEKRVRPSGPDAILISAGFDSHAADPIGSLRLTESDYGQLTRWMMELAEKSCGGKLVSVLEGGYQPQVVQRSVKAHCQELSNGNRQWDRGQEAGRHPTTALLRTANCLLITSLRATSPTGRKPGRRPARRAR